MIALLLLFNLLTPSHNAQGAPPSNARGPIPISSATPSPASVDGPVPPNKIGGLLNKLLAPGPLIIGHTDLGGTQCLKCHEATQGIPNSKCLACHKDIGLEVGTHEGFHGLATKTCVQCHKDHLGQNFDSTLITEETFDHALTGFRLRGKHAALECTDCHKATRGEHGREVVRPGDTRYLGLPSTCVSCHKKDDVHKFQGDFAKKDCKTCHSDVSWKMPVTFNHATDAHYKLEGAHAKITCAACHLPKDRPDSIYKWPNLKTEKCLACHQDHHKDRLSPEFSGGVCLKCHTMKTWKIRKFDHTITGYPLRGKHSAVQCIDCHKQPEARPLKSAGFQFTGLSQDCASCHKDYHGFGDLESEQLGDLSQCQACHSEKGWKPFRNFNHNNDTRYAIGGKHLRLTCFQCHQPDKQKPVTNPPSRIYHWSELPRKTCETCHRSPHAKVFTKELLAKKCTDCHTDAGWRIFRKRGGTFDHDRATRFILTGKHRTLTCIACHGAGTKQVFKFGHPEKAFCVDCHKNVHLGQFTAKTADQACNTCHTTSDFKRRLYFKHSTTGFSLTGRHLGITCDKCHAPTNKWLPTTPPKRASQFQFANREKQFCVTCHQNVHLDQFDAPFTDQACSTCHTTTDWRHRLPFSHDSTRYKLEGKHKALQCSACHFATQDTFPNKSGHFKSKFLFPELPAKACMTCHTDPHRGDYGPSCAECHNLDDWRRTRDFHKRYTLEGVHNSLRCQECHKGGRQLAGQSDNCILCHQRDDVHNMALPACGTCHRQQFWENTSFQHSLTSFPLRGVHRTLDCNMCHNRGVYTGLPNQCVSCHRADALSFTGTPNHQSLLGQDCSLCHNQFSFK